MALFGTNSNGEWRKFAHEINATFNKGGVFKDESVSLSYKGLNIVMKLDFKKLIKSCYSVIIYIYILNKI